MYTTGLVLYLSSSWLFSRSTEVAVLPGPGVLGVLWLLELRSTFHLKVLE